MLPQSCDGKYKVYGKSELQKKQIFKDLKILEEAGVFLIVLECILEKLAKEIICKSKIPIIGIGASKRLSWSNISSGRFIRFNRL